MRAVGTRIKMTGKDRHGKLHTFTGTIQRRYWKTREYGIQWDGEPVCIKLPAGCIAPRYGIVVIK